MTSSQVKRQVYASTGFSLIEIMLALAVIAIGLIAIIGLVPRGVQASRDAADNTLAATIAHDTFNDLRRQALKTWPPTLAPNTYYDAAATNPVPSGSADRYFNVQLTSQSSLPNLLGLTARVTWPDKSATSIPVNTNFFFTQIANYQ